MDEDFNSFITVGIDLGTSNCCITYLTKEGKIEIIRDPKYPDKITIPSLVDVSMLSEGGGVLVGNEIDKNHISHNKNIFHSFKRLIGHDIDDVFSTNLKEILGYKICSKDGKIMLVDTFEREYSLQEVIFFLLRRIKNLIDDHLKEPWKCIITVPAYFNEIQRQITVDAIKISGIPFIKLLNEPTSAAFAYLYHNNVLSQNNFNKKILVIDYGAGTLDLTVLEITRDDDSDGTMCEVLGSYGDNNFGGIDITKKIYTTMFQNSEIDLNLKMQISEEIKLILSSQQNAEYYCPELNKTFTYLYDIFTDQLKEFSKHIILTIEKVLEVCELSKKDINDVVLVGGSFKNLNFRKHISDYFEKNIAQPTMLISSKESITKHSEILLYEDIAVSLGASIHGYYNNVSKDVILVDRIPLSIGIETVGGKVAKIIERNSIIPTSRKKSFQPELEEQKEVDINIYQGESMYTQHCQHIGTFTFHNIPINKSNIAKPIIYVNIEVDHNGIISINAYDKKNLVSETFQISCKSIALSDEEIDKIMTHYEMNILDEQLHRDIIKHYYELISIIDKISHQLNYNYSLEMTDSIKEVIRTDIELIINKMDNRFIMKKYLINKKLISKVIVINNLKYVPKEYKPLDSNEIHEFCKFLSELKYYLVDRYQIYIDNEYSMKSINEVAKIETVEDGTEDNLDCNYVNENTIIIDLSEFSSLIENTKTSKDSFEELIYFLQENVSFFGLTDEGVNLLLNKIEELKNFNDESDYEILTNRLNEFCIFLKNSYEKL